MVQEGVTEVVCCASTYTQGESEAPAASFPISVPYKCFLCGQCMMPHLHYHDCPLGYSDADAQVAFIRDVGGVGRDEGEQVTSQEL